jgi:hypothetical protein
MGYSAADIANHARHKMLTEVDPPRNDIYLAVIDIAGRVDEKGNTDS